MAGVRGLHQQLLWSIAAQSGPRNADGVNLLLKSTVERDTFAGFYILEDNRNYGVPFTRGNMRLAKILDLNFRSHLVRKRWLRYWHAKPGHEQHECNSSYHTGR